MKFFNLIPRDIPTGDFVVPGKRNNSFPEDFMIHFPKVSERSYKEEYNVANNQNKDKSIGEEL